jgi:quercetin dioxygenase-like cupin family protein
MKLIKKSEGTPYDAGKHFNVWSTRKLAADEDSHRITVSLSHFLPNGGVEMSGSPSEKIYYVLSGSMIVTTESEECTLQAGDIVYFGPNEERAVRIAGSEVCTVLVCIVKV